MRFLFGVAFGLMGASAFIEGQALHSVNTNDSHVYKPLFAVHSNSTPLYQNVSGRTANPLVKALQPAQSPSDLDIQRRQADSLPVGTCAPGTPCSNGACCSKTGICGYSPAECAADVCISNCDAKAECGEYGIPGNNTCPLNVCCSQYGFCGTTSDFCDAGCQQGYGGCGTVSEPSCGGASATKRRIGYYEAWSSVRSCDRRLPSDIDVTILTHINFAFVYFHPTTFEIVPMNEGDVALYPQFTALKRVKPSLKTWISVGGWSFNDATNSPNTQTAFSDMAGSATNRQIFIKSLLSFMQTWGFDGVDIDWEYPGADDRGGITADTINYVTLLRELKSAFGNRYGVSVTIPASYWYLRWFDLKGMEANVDFFNVMTYDIHGVWDSSNKFTGPYVRPHTNLTEIRDSLDLLWRNNIDPSVVNMGLGWYGRSFTLKDPNCNSPGCVFSYGGNAGECTKSPGTLSNAEIQRIITANSLIPTFDRDAAVKWVTWDTDQWVSYDDGESIQLKMDFANDMCLGGTLVWSVDQDSVDHTSANDLVGVGTGNGVTAKDAQTYRDLLSNTSVLASKRNSCYWSFCGESCVAGYFTETFARGQVVGIDRDDSCSPGEYKRLCCAPGTNTGTCSWHGFRGVGLSCVSNYCPNGTDLIATNTNQYQWSDNLENFNDWTCNGGSQSYCCSGFVPSPYTNTDSLHLIGKNEAQDDTKWELQRKHLSLSSPFCQNDNGKNAINVLLGLSGSLFMFAPSAIDMGGGTLIGSMVDDMYVCIEENVQAAHEQNAGIVANLGLGALGTGGIEFGAMAPPPVGFIEVPKQLINAKGGWQRATYGKKDQDCSVTYICRYGHGWDEVCDNQRWGIDKIMGGKTVYNYDKRPIGGTYKDQWGRLFRNKEYRARAQAKVEGESRDRCEVDEFPLGSLKEREVQALRLINGQANGAQGQDWDTWLNLVFKPCSSLRQVRGIQPARPPITWKFGPFTEGDSRSNALEYGQHFIQKYGWDSQTIGSLCWATYTYKNKDDIAFTVTASDHGFRAHPDDPMFKEPYNWHHQDYVNPPSDPDNLPDSVASVQWMKREVALSVLKKDLPLSAIYEADIVEDIISDIQRVSEAPAPTEASAFSTSDKENRVPRRSKVQYEMARETAKLKIGTQP